MTFREIEKEPLTIQAPPEIAELVRQYAVKERTSISEIGTELLCRALGRDPREFGIEPDNTVAASAAASA